MLPSLCSPATRWPLPQQPLPSLCEHSTEQVLSRGFLGDGEEPAPTLMPGESRGSQPHGIELVSDGEAKASSAGTAPAPPPATRGHDPRPLHWASRGHPGLRHQRRWEAQNASSEASDGHKGSEEERGHRSDCSKPGHGHALGITHCSDPLL